jgi:hypothetical protein
MGSRSQHPRRGGYRGVTFKDRPSVEKRRSTSTPQTSAFRSTAGASWSSPAGSRGRSCPSPLMERQSPGCCLT